MCDKELLVYLQRNAKTKLEFAHNFYQQKYRSYCIYEKNVKDKCKAILVAIIITSLTFLLIAFVIFMIKAFIIPSKMMSLPMQVAKIVETIGTVIASVVILVLLVYLIIVYAKYWNKTNKDEKYIKEKMQAFDKTEMIKKIIVNLENLSEDELNRIINKDIEDF